MRPSGGSGRTTWARRRIWDPAHPGALSARCWSARTGGFGGVRPDNSCGAPIVDLGPYEVGGSGPQPCLGDVNGDGDVDWHDLTCLLDRYGTEHTQPGFDSVCDFDTDGVIGLRDLATLLSVYGMPCQ
jgi:hypothetical protein